jgi:hypothetical protein
MYAHFLKIVVIDHCLSRAITQNLDLRNLCAVPSHICWFGRTGILEACDPSGMVSCKFGIEGKTHQSCDNRLSHKLSHNGEYGELIAHYYQVKYLM